MSTHIPLPEPLLTCGAGAITNFGWFCTKECATRFQQGHFQAYFDRNAAGEVQYYPNRENDKLPWSIALHDFVPYWGSQTRRA